jgi:hypothetical protein
MAVTPKPEDLAKEFLHELQDLGESLAIADSEKVLLKEGDRIRRLPFWKVDLMVFQFLAAHSLLSQVSVSDVLTEVLSMIS